MAHQEQTDDWVEPTVRRTFSITTRQAQRLKDIARREGRSQADLVRELLERALVGIDDEERVKAQRRLRGWAREDAYEERMSRITRRKPDGTPLDA